MPSFKQFNIKCECSAQSTTPIHLRGIRAVGRKEREPSLTGPGNGGGIHKGSRSSTRITLSKPPKWRPLIGCWLQPLLMEKKRRRAEVRLRRSEIWGVGLAWARTFHCQRDMNMDAIQMARSYYKWTTLQRYLRGNKPNAVVLKTTHGIAY